MYNDLKVNNMSVIQSSITLNVQRQTVLIVRLIHLHQGFKQIKNDIQKTLKNHILKLGFLGFFKKPQV